MAQRVTIDEAEVEKFSRIADEWWDAGGKFKPLHQLNPVRLEFVTRTIAAHFGRDRATPHYLSGIKMLDIGCGGGLLSEPMARLGAKITGVDASEKNIKTATLHAEQSGLSVRYLHGAAEDLTAKKETFDVILNMEVIEHVSDPALFLHHCAALLAPGGLMFVATLNRTLKSLAMAKIGAEYILRWLPRGTHDWNKFLKPSEIAQMLRDNGLELQETTGMTFSPLGNGWSLTDDTSVNYVVSCIKPKGA